MNSSSGRLHAALAVLLGILLIASYFLPLFEGVLFEITGPEIIDFVMDAPDDKLQTFDKPNGWLMLITTIGGVFIGFLSVGLGAVRLAKLNLSGNGIPALLGAFNILLGGTLIYRMESADVNFFNALLPRPSWAFYLFMILHVLLIVLWWTGRAKPQTISPSPSDA